MLSATRIFGLICTWAACDYIFPTPTTPKIQVPSTASSLIVNTNCGSVEGSYANSLNGKLYRAFEGVPFAEPPVGQLRFWEPQPKTRWRGILKANKKISCMQMDPLRYYNVIGQEDCLVLNIYTPEDRGTRGRKLPVFVFIHGGSYFWGSGHLYGPTYIMDQDIILVTINYRLGPLGFLSTGDEASYGNWGLKDQTLAIDWIRDNIGYFGGDPSRITIGGQSAGGASAHLHMMSPLSKGKFIGVISQSASALAPWALPPNQTKLTKRLAERVRCKLGNNSQMIKCLRRKSAKTIVSSQYNLFEWLENPPILFGPTLEPNHPNAFITETPESLYAQGKVANIPWITGVTKDEGDLFSLVNYLAPLGTRNLLTHVNDAIPRVLMYDPKNISITKQIQSYYLHQYQNGISLSGYEALHSLSNMVGDRFFYVPFHKTLRVHSNSVQAPLYAYRFTYKGRHSVTEKVLVPSAEWGVMHMDDMQYLFNSSFLYAPIAITDREYSISDYFIKLWTSFVETGAPIISSSPQRLTTSRWIPYEKNGQHQLLEINFDSKMRDEIDEENEDRIKFWKNISLY